MVYNRCVGTRFCSNNCPYKVRRFNYFGYGNEQHRPVESWNPDVTVRGRGVMEKCTYCIQRIAEARIVADRDSKPVGEVKTACQTACPTQAFTFGNLADPDSQVSERKRSPLDFAMLEEQNTKPAYRHTKRSCAILILPLRPVRHERYTGTAEFGDRGRSRRAVACAEAPAPPRRPGGLSQRYHRLDNRSHLRNHAARAGIRLVVDRLLTLHGADTAPGGLNPLSVLRRDRHLGRELAGGMGLRHPQLRMVDRYRLGRHDHLGAVLPDAGEMAHLDQPHCRIHDAVRRRSGRGVSSPSSGAPLVRLLVVFLSEHDDAVGPIPQSTTVGFLGALHLRPGFRAVLVPWPAARPCERARPRDLAPASK